MDRKIVLIDGNSIINRAFFGVPPLTNEEGLHTNAIYGFLNIMFRIVEAEQPDHLAVAFDVHAPTFRHEIYKDYKGTRKGMPDELKEQVPVLKELLKAMDIKMLEKAGLEADDILGTLARRAEKEGMSVTVVSGDRDLLQIATDHVKVCIPKTRGGKTVVQDYHAEQVIEEYGLTPAQIIELKALMGDTADNIPGVPKVGEKTATQLILQFGQFHVVDGGEPLLGGMVFGVFAQVALLAGFFHFVYYTGTFHLFEECVAFDHLVVSFFSTGCFSHDLKLEFFCGAVTECVLHCRIFSII